jgi:diaminopimelate decarboxylase
VIGVETSLSIAVGPDLAGLDPEGLAARFGTPFYLYDFDAVERRVAALRAALPARFDLAYAAKANPALALVSHLGRLGVDGDIASGGELELVARAGISAARTIFTGPGKNEAEHRAAVAAGVRAVTVESPGELARLEAVAAAMGRRQPILLRLSVGDRSRHETVRIIGDDGLGKFGMSAADLEGAARHAAGSPHLELLGVHAFGASNLRDVEALVGHVEATVAYASHVADLAGTALRLVDAGGGLGIPYADDEEPLNLTALARGLASLDAGWAADPRLSSMRVLLEPGRFLVGPAGVYVCRIVDRKSVGGREVAVVDGGIHHLLRPALIRQPHRLRLLPVRGSGEPAVSGGSAAGALGATMAVAGPLCTGLDILSRAAVLPDARVGDLVAVLDTGAYGFTESMPLFLSRPLPVELGVRGGDVREIRRRIEPREFLESQSIPDW